MALVRVRGGDLRGVHRGERSPVGKSIQVGVNGIGHGGVIKRDVVSENHDEINLRGRRRGANAWECLLAVLREPFVLVGGKAVSGKVLRAVGCVAVQRVYLGIYVTI